MSDFVADLKYVVWKVVEMLGFLHGDWKTMRWEEQLYFKAFAFEFCVLPKTFGFSSPEKLCVSKGKTTNIYTIMPKVLGRT